MNIELFVMNITENRDVLLVSHWKSNCLLVISSAIGNNSKTTNTTAKLTKSWINAYIFWQLIKFSLTTKIHIPIWFIWGISYAWREECVYFIHNLCELVWNKNNCFYRFFGNIQDVSEQILSENHDMMIWTFFLIIYNIQLFFQSIF